MFFIEEFFNFRIINLRMINGLERLYIFALLFYDWIIIRIISKKRG